MEEKEQVLPIYLTGSQACSIFLLLKEAIDINNIKLTDLLDSLTEKDPTKRIINLPIETLETTINLIKGIIQDGNTVASQCSTIANSISPG